MVPATGSPAASSNDRLAGFGTSPALAHGRAFSANERAVIPKTSSPGRNRVTAAPTDSTTPAMSTPFSQPAVARVGAGRRSARTRYGSPRSACQSSAFT